MQTVAFLSLGWIFDLYRIGQQPATPELAGRTLQDLLGHVVSGFAASSGSLALTEPDRSTLRIVAGVGLPDGVVGSTVAFGDRIIGWVAQERCALRLTAGVADDTRFANRIIRDPARVPAVAMCWPLILHGEVVGVVCLNRDASSAPYTEEDMSNAAPVGNLIAIVIDNIRLHREAQERIGELQVLNDRLQAAHAQLLQSEKMASIGQLAAGIAHEINNPVGYVASNLGTLQRYVNDLFRLINACEKAESCHLADPALNAELASLKRDIDLAFLQEDTVSLVRESQEGLGRVRKIIQDLKEFSHVDRAEWQWTDLHAGLESTLNIVWNELKYKAEVVKNYGKLPQVECIPSQINQVFMNLLVNAAQAIEGHGIITIVTGAEGEWVYVDITDTGRGMSAEVQKRIFEPFFTTKPVGKGTGLGLSLSYGIVAKHHGRIDVRSTPSEGASFRVWIPRGQPGEQGQESPREVGT